MPVPYRKPSASDAEGTVAHLDIVWIASARTYYGALLRIDAAGRPVEFVHNQLSAPSGFLWSPDRVAALGVRMLAHSLFDACCGEPDLLIGKPSLGSADFCRGEIAASIPFALVSKPGDQGEIQWRWVNEPPLPGMRGHRLLQVIQGNGLALEPFERLALGLREVYPEARWSEVRRD